MKQLFRQRDGVFEPDTKVKTHTTGIKWISIIPNLSSVQLMHFTECNIISEEPWRSCCFFCCCWTKLWFCLNFLHLKGCWIGKAGWGSSNNSKINWFVNKTILLGINFYPDLMPCELQLSRPPQPLRFQIVLRKTCLMILTSLHFK